MKYDTIPQKEVAAPPNKIFSPNKRQKLNIVAICLNIFLPWVLFAAIYAVLSFSFHYQHPVLAWTIFGFGVGAVLCSAILAYRARKQARQAMWFNFSTIALLLAVILAGTLGDANFWYNMKPFYDIENLNSYPSVDPSTWKGQQVMDAGRVYFSDGTKLKTEWAMGFKNLDLYCVAPIVKGDGAPASGSYDFWAVGLNCCSGVAADFRCGEFNNPHARSGLRLMRDDQRPYFRLAVQQATAAYSSEGVTANHPLFFYWMQDPVAEMNSYRDDGFKYYLLGIFTHFAFNLFCVLCTSVMFSKVGSG